MRDRIVEISIIKVLPGGSEVERTIRVNPCMPIPPEATAIHHITDADVASAPTFKMVAQELLQLFDDADIAGFNSNRFDVPLLTEEFLRAGISFDVSKRRFVDVQTIFHKMEQRTLVAAYKFYCGKDLDEAHSANADTRATYEVLKAQLDRYNSLKNDVDFLAEFSTQNKNVDLMGRIIRNEAGQEVFNFGKYKGQVVEDVFRRDSGYYSWMMQGEFPANTKQVITAIKLRLK
jgi:DNA polymerase-3 subunit epsilon